MTGSLVADARHFLKSFILVVLTSSPVSAQQTTFQDTLLDHFIGNWVLQGTIEGKETTHDVVAEWVLGHQYVQFHEVSREKKSRGEPAYEATVFIGWDQPRASMPVFGSMRQAGVDSRIR